MGGVSPRADLEAWAARSAPEPARQEAAHEFQRSLQAYLSRRREPIGHLKVTVGDATTSLAAALAPGGPSLQNITLEGTGAPPPGPRWDYLLPVRSFRFAADGSVQVDLEGKGDAGRAQRGIGRVLLRERFRPELGRSGSTSGSNGALAPGLRSLPEFAEAIRHAALTPLSLVVLLYLSDRRVRFELDLADDGLEPDIRAGRLSLDHFVPRSSRISHGVDAFVARGELSVSAARLLEVLVETHGLTAIEAASTFGGIHEMSNSALEALRGRRLATFDAAHGMYRARLDAFLASGSGPLNEPLQPMSTPALRTSVTELIAAADSRATCPLCGDVLPPAPHGMLCPKCAAEVGVTGAERRSS